MNAARRRSATLRWSLAVGLLMVPAVTAAADAAKEPPAPANATGRLAIEGRLIKQLVLESRGGGLRTIDRPPPVLELPGGEYRLEMVQLQGGCTWLQRGESGEPWLRVAPGQEPTLRVGAPLRPTAKVTPGGGYLAMSYALQDAAGREYLGRPRGDSPRFTVFQNDREVGSGCFEYG